MIEAAFDTARRLFGLTFSAGRVPLYHPDARAWEVTDARRPSRRPVHRRLFRARLQAQRRLDDARCATRRSSPATFARSSSTSAISPSRRRASRRCCRFDDARTLFHEFGHALHGLLSNVTYPLLAGTAVSSDFVELPSQLYEHWLEVPEILQQLRASRADRRADAEGAARPPAGDAHLQSGLCHRGIHRLRAGRSRPASLPEADGARRHAVRTQGSWRASACRRKS